MNQHEIVITVTFLHRLYHSALQHSSHLLLFLVYNFNSFKYNFALGHFQIMFERIFLQLSHCLRKPSSVVVVDISVFDDDNYLAQSSSFIQTTQPAFIPTFNITTTTF